MPGSFKKAATKCPPREGDVLWCPIPACRWHLKDSWSARRRMGEHVANSHPGDVVYREGEWPEDIPKENEKEQVS